MLFFHVCPQYFYYITIQVTNLSNYYLPNNTAMSKDDENDLSEESINKDIEKLELQEIEFDFQNSSFEIESDESLLKWSKSRGKKKE